MVTVASFLNWNFGLKPAPFPPDQPGPAPASLPWIAVACAPVQQPAPPYVPTEEGRPSFSPPRWKCHRIIRLPSPSECRQKPVMSDFYFPARMFCQFWYKCKIQMQNTTA